MLRPQKGNSGYDTLLNFGLWAQNLRQGIVMKTSFETRVSGTIILFSFFIFLIFSQISLIKIYTNAKTSKRKLWSFVQQ